MSLMLKIEDSNGCVLANSTGKEQVVLVHKREYQPGDRIILETDTPYCYLIICLEDSIAPAFVYMRNKRHEMIVPFGEKRICYSPKSFTGTKHLLTARCASHQEIEAYKNVALNPFDCHENNVLFPHSSANVETRDESVFASRNAVDGITINTGHGAWPYQSWGINRDPNAEIQIEFGRDVIIDKVCLTTRADFPHDSWWVNATLEFSDGSSLGIPLTKTAEPQTQEFAPRTAKWVTLKNLIKADDESPFPALSQIEIWGTEKR